MHPENGVPQSHARSGFGFYLVMTIVITGCLMGLCYLAMLKAWYGEVGVAAEVRVPAAWANGLSVTLVDSRCPASSSAGELKAWQQLLERNGIPFETVVGIRRDDGTGSGVLVLPSTKCLGDSGKEGIRGWLRKGGGVLATGALGLRDESGRAQGSGFLREIAGAEVREIHSVDTPAYLTLAARPPLALGLGPGERWRVRPGTWAAATSSLLADGYWSDSHWEPLEDAPRQEMVAITHHATDQGRVVWIGAGLDAVSRAERNRSSWERLFLNSIYWAGRRPLAGISTWPAGQAVAVVVAQEIHEVEQLPEALVMARSLRAKHIPATFFIRASLARATVHLKELAQLGEVAVLGDVTSPSLGSNHESILKQKEKLERPLQRPVRGFRFPDGAQHSTLPDLVQAGYSYYLDNVSLVSAAPVVAHFPESFLFPLDTRTLIGLPTVGRDDFSVLSEYKGPAYSVEGIAEQLWQDFQKARWLGGLYVLNYRTDLLGSPATRPALFRVLDHLNEQDTWLASASEVARWWLQREQIGVEVSKLSNRRIRMGLWNKGREDMSEVVVLIALPYVPSHLEVSATVFGDDGATHEILPDLGLLRVRILRLKAQSTQTWVIDMR